MQELNFESVDFFNTALAIKKVKKSSGILQEFIPEKLIKVLEWACAGTLVEPYDLFKKIKPHLVDEMTTEEIQSAAIKVAADNITKTSADYQYVASNLAMFGLRKQVYDQFEPIKLVELIEQNIEAGVYDPEVLQKYSAKELQEFDDFIKHDKDFTMTYAGTMQLIEKYLVKNRVTGKVYETPQFAYMLMGMVLHQNEKPGKARTENVKNYYEAASDRKISLPTPLMAGVRTPTRQFSSCVVIEAGDSLDSINGSSASIIKYISKRAGIGIHGGAIRAEGSTIGHGEVKHTGVIPFWKHFQSAVKSCSQGGLRGGAATMHYPVWHLEFENLIVLKNNKGVDENRIRHLDYSVQLNDLMFDRLLSDGYITLFSPDVADGKLFEYFYNDQEAFEELYEKLEKDASVRKKRIKATEVFFNILNERANTGRIYLMFIDNVSKSTPFDTKVDPIKMSNLCITGDQLVASDKGLLTAKELYTMGTKLITHDGSKKNKTSEMKLRRENVPVYKITLANGMTHTVTEDHEVMTDNGLVAAIDLVANKSKIAINKSEGIFGNKSLDDEALDEILKHDDFDLIGTHKGKPFNDAGIRTVMFCDKETQIRFINRVFAESYSMTSLDHRTFSRIHVLGVILSSYEAAKMVQIMLNNMGINLNLEQFEFGVRESWNLSTTYTGELKRLETVLDKFDEYGNTDFGDIVEYHPDFVECTSVELLPETEDVYCPTVESEEHLFVANGIITSNCQEILLPTSPISEIDEEIALCTLSAFVLGSFDHKDQDEINKLSMVMVRALDNLLDYQDYPVHQALAAKRRRALGIGVTNYAAWLAQNFRRYDDEKSTLREVHELFERLQFGLIKASNDLAKEKGMPDLVARTNYAKGLLPIDWYNKNVDKLTGAPKYACDWETLRADVLEHGVRNSTLSAFMPCETSSQVSNSTNGIEPPRAAITTKQSKDGVFNQIVPEIESLESVYDYAWDMSKRGNRGYLSHVAVMQKFVDQSISTNTYYDPQNYENNKVPISQMLEDIIFANYHGIKTLYYHNTRDGADASEEFECDSCSV